MATLSSRKALKGAIPVPGPTMIIGALVSCGTEKLLFGEKKHFILSPTAALSAKKVEHTP